MTRFGLLGALSLALMPHTGAWAAQGDPRIRLEEPEHGERRFVAPAAIAIEARAAAARGRTIVKVEFFAEGQPIGQATAAPYETVWTQVPEGRYRLRARATDDHGATAWSAPVLVRVRENREPRVRLIAPHPGATYGAPATVELRAQARDRDHNLERVEFYANGMLLGSDTAPRYRLSWTGVPAGTYNVMARAVDALGASDDSRPVSIVVTGNQAPSVALTSPTDGAVIPAPGSVTMTADASDPDGAVAQVEFFEGTTLLATVTTPPYTFTVNDVQAGSYTFAARATDDTGASTTSAPVSVTVNAAVAQIYYIHVDHLNTPRLVADATGTTVWRWDQKEPFGDSVPDENPSGLGAFDLRLRLPGQVYDAETGLHHNYFRDYDPSIGIYKQSDPIGLHAGVITYAYVHGGSLSWTDPLGLDVRISLYAGAHGAGHIGIGLVTGEGEQGTVGFYPQTLPSTPWQWVPGVVLADDPTKQQGSIVIKTTPRQDQCVTKCINDWTANPGSYSLKSRQCRDFVLDCLTSCGIKGGGPQVPWGFFYNLQRYYQRCANNACQ